MKKIIPNLLSFSALALFFVLATATSQDFDFGFYQMEIERISGGLKITNQDDFDYENFEVSIFQTDTLQSSAGTDSLVFTSYRSEDLFSLKTNESLDVPFFQLKSEDQISAPSSLIRFEVRINGTCPDHDSCEFNKAF